MFALSGIRINRVRINESLLYILQFISFYHQLGTVLIPRLVSSDADFCSNNTVRYFFQGQLSESDPFIIDEFTGEITLSRDLTNATLSFTRTLAVEDRLSPVASHLTGVAQLTVIVGELLPVDFEVTNGFIVPPLSRTSDDEFQHGKFVVVVVVVSILNMIKIILFAND